MFHLTLVIALTTSLCILNVVIEFQETRANHSEEKLTNVEVWVLTFKEYWGSIVVAFVAVLFSIFVFALFGFHSYIISLNLTT